MADGFQIGLFATASVTLKAMNYGAGVDLWNVSEARGAKFTKVGHFPPR